MKLRYLVTGGAGFIGSHLVEALLAANCEVVVLDDFSTGRLENLPASAQVVEGSVLNEALVEQLSGACAGIFHLAAIASVPRCNEQWIESHRVNMTGSLAVFNASRKRGSMPVVYASSAAVYGEQGPGRIAEDADLRPHSPYGADKLGTELHGRVAASLFGIPTVGLRFFNVYGPRQDPASPYSGVISIFAARSIAGLAITLHGDGQQTRDFVYVGDVVAHLLAAMSYSQRTPKSGRVFNVCTGSAQSIVEVARVIIEMTGSTSFLANTQPRAGDIRASVGDPFLARRELGLGAEIALREGLRCTLGCA